MGREPLVRSKALAFRVNENGIRREGPDGAVRKEKTFRAVIGKPD